MKRVISLFLVGVILFGLTAFNASAASQIYASDIISTSRSLIGYPYVSGGASPSAGGFDCTGLVYYVYNTCLGYDIALSTLRSKSALANAGTLIYNKSAFLPGDIIQGTTSGGNHVGICVGNGNMIDAGSSRGVSERAYNNSWFTIEYAVRLPGVLQSGSSETGPSTLSINPTTAPSGTLTEGNSFSLQGTVTSNYPVTYFEGVVYDSANQIFISAGCYPNSYSVDIRSSDVNQNLPFGSLTTGSYYLVYNAVDSSGASTSWNSGWFTVAGGSTLPTMPTVTVPQSTFNTGSTVTIDWTAAKGNDNYYLQVIRDGVYIVDFWSGQTRTYYLENAQPGNYTVYVSANNSAGTSGSSVCYFQVVDPSHTLDINGMLNGQSAGDINGYGVFDVYLNGSLYQSNCSDFYEALPIGTTYEINNILPSHGCSYDGIYSGSRSGVIGSEDVFVWLSFSTNDYGKITEKPTPTYYNGHSYLYYSTPVTWYFAKEYCESIGGHLVTLSDASENQFVKDCLGGNSAWIGLSDAGSENVWYWVTGESYAFSDWYPGQPDNYSVNSQGSEDYVQYNNIAWNDNDGAALMGFVCEIEDPSLILNINGVIDGVMQEGLNGCGTADVYINGICVAEGCSDYYMAWPKGTTYEIKNIHPAAGYSYDGIYSGSRTGIFGTHDPLVCLSFSENDFSKITETPTQFHFNGHTYLYYSSPVTWYFAKEYCESLGGHLITITSEQENQLAKQITDNNNVWLGASDAGSEGTWYWVTGEPFEYTNWLELQPDNTPNDSTGEENYAELNPTWTTQQGWNDVRGCVTHGFICEFDYISCINGHSYVNTVTEPTCTEQGYTTHTCSVCGDTYVDSYVGALGHSFGAWTQSKAPSCTEKGTEKRSCSRCGKTETREIAALGHDYHAVVTAPTCTEKGYTTYTCSRCGDSYVADEVAALGHTPGAAVEENRVNPTCTANGGFDTVTYCSACGIKLNCVHTNLAALGHLWGDGVIDPAATCTSDGVRTFTCLRCGETKTEAIAATGHTAGDSARENEIAATCTTAGGYDMVIRCTVCNVILYTEHFEIAALGHDYQTAVTAPTCTEGGYTTYTCSRCGDSYIDTYTAALGHAWDAGVVTIKPTETATGIMTYTCTRCEETKAETIPMLEPDPTPSLPCDGGENCPGNMFTDMPAKGNWAHDAIDWAIVNKITAGTSAATFSPNTGCTRAQVVTFLWRAAGEPEPTTNNNPFSDVKERTYYYKAVLWAVEKKVTAGTSATTFSPDTTCTRAQIVTFLWRYEGEPAATTTANPFADVKAGAYYEKAVLWAAETGVTAGTSATTFSPGNTCTRAQVVTFLYRELAANQ